MVPVTKHHPFSEVSEANKCPLTEASSGKSLGWPKSTRHDLKSALACCTRTMGEASKVQQALVVDDLLYMANPLRRSDWLLEIKDGDLVRHLPCHSAILCNASKVLNELDAEVKPDSHGKTVIPFPGSEKEARSCLVPIENSQLFLMLMLNAQLSTDQGSLS